MPVTRVKSRWVDGNLQFLADDGTVIAEFHDGAQAMIPRGGALNLRTRLTTAQANAGATILPAVPGYRYRLIDWTLTAVGGNAATATSVRLRGTQATTVVSLAIVAIAALTRSTSVKPNSANVTMLADGAGLSACDANTPIAVDVDNGNLATATHLDVNLTYVLEPAA